MNESWAPPLAAMRGTLHHRILSALRQDIAAGRLVPGGRMPPHRELARRLGIGVGTVTRAYAEAERLGLLTSAVGRGTFVAQSAAPPEETGAEVYPEASGALIDLSLNLPTLDAVAGQIGDALLRIRSRPDIGDAVALAPHAGVEAHRQALAEWLRRSVHAGNVDWRKLVLTTGAQQAMALAIDAECQPGDVVLMEAATFSGMRAIATQRQLRGVGVAMDRQGILPDALEAAIKEHGARVLYLQPTLQNPTTRTMSLDRRQEIVAIARTYDLVLLEDEVNAPIAFALGGSRSGLVPLSTLAPERTYYICSVSKSLAPGLRVGILVAPSHEAFDRVCLAMRAQSYAAGTLGALIVMQWIKDGVADQLAGAVAQEASSRLVLAQRMLGRVVEDPSFATSLNIWLPMPELRAERVANSALRRGVMLTPPSSFLVDGSSVSGLRVCLNGVSRPGLERALRVVRSILNDETVSPRMSVV